MKVEPVIRQQAIEEYNPAAATSSKWLVVLVLVGLSAVFLASVLLRPAAGEYFTVCGFKNFTGLPCPGCGLTHSFCALGKGDVVDAFAFNLLGPPLFLALVLVWIRSACVLANRSHAVYLLDGIARRFNVVRSFAIAFGVYGIVRITYLLAFGPLNFHDSPLSQLIARLIH